MSEDAELQAKIVALAGRINRHKANEQRSENDQASQLTYDHHAYPSHQWTPQRGTPYGRPAPRGQTYGYRSSPHRNRQLILNGPSNPTTNTAEGVVSNASRLTKDAASPGWVSKHDRHKQLINANIYEKQAQERTRAMEQTRKQKQAAREEREKSMVNMHLRSLQDQPTSATASDSSAPTPQIIIDQVRFLVADGGSKLIRTSDETNLGKPTPKRATVGGVTFVRSKRGNLYRAGLIKIKRDQAGLTKSTELCPQFSTTGTCPRGPMCHKTHDPTRVAICRNYLSTGECPLGDACDLSHDATPARVPACLHFQRNACTNENCRYAHVHTNPGAPVCVAFARLGYCDVAALCPNRHVHECPSYANKGICRIKNCRLPHVDRAGNMRKAAAAAMNVDDEEARSDISSDGDELDSDDFDSDGIEDEIKVEVTGDTSHALSQQADYVGLD